MSDHGLHLPPSRFDPSKNQPLTQTQRAEEIEVSQEEAVSLVFTELTDEGAFALSIARRFQTLEEKIKRSVKEERTEKLDAKKELDIAIEKVEAVADQYSQKNPEFQKRTLLFLKSHLLPSDSKEEILRKVLETYPDPSLADEALDFLLEVATGELKEKLLQAKQDLNKDRGREVKAGRNIAEQSREFSKQGLGTPTALRDLYRFITGNPRDAATLFNDLSTRFPYEQMKTIIEFILHALGQDLKSKGPSIDRGELHRLVSEGRTMQAILGIFRFFKSRIPLVQQSFARQTIPLPERINFEQLSKTFMSLLQERYPSSDKVLQMAPLLGLSNEVVGQIVVYTQMRDAIRQIAPKLFRSDQHKQDILKSFIEAIDKLDEQIEEEEEEKE